MSKYCDIDPKFPKVAWFGLLYKIAEDMNLIIPIKKLHLNKKEELAYFKKVAKGVGFKDDEYGTMLDKMKLARKIKNKREYWTREKELIKIHPIIATSYYLNLVRCPGLYQILAVGGYMDKKGNWEWAEAV
ncbi:hypothetical protein KKA02_02210 [Patescibacteria group bacterium]|nr:hypothetical protein [Patescibacteria group bacterium]